MRLYESLVSNIGIGIGKANTDCIKKLFSTGIQSPFERFLKYIGAINTDWVCSYMKKESESEFVFTFINNWNQYDTYKMNGMGHILCYRPVIYKGKPYAKDYSIKGTAHIPIYELNEQTFYILNNVPELRDTYKMLDKLMFKKYDIDEWQWEWELNYDNLPVRIYYWKDSKFSFEEITTLE